MNADWHQLIQRYMNGVATDEETKNLQQALKTDPELRVLYLDYINLDIALEAKAEANEANSELGCIVDLKKAAPLAAGRWKPLAAAAAVAALFLVLASLIVSTPGDTVATIQNARRTSDFSPGEPLRKGQVLVLSDGRVRISFQSGAILAVEAPAELQILGPNSARLRRGLVTVRVPGKIKGFVLHTPHETVTDLGTSFGVDVDHGGGTAISVFEGEIELGDDHRLLAGQSIELGNSPFAPRLIPYTEGAYSETWQISFGVEALEGNVRLAAPSERPIPGQVEDSDSLLLFPEREDVTLPKGSHVDAVEPGVYRRPFRRSIVELTEDLRVDSFLLQYNPARAGRISETRTFRGKLQFDRPIVALIMQKDLLAASDFVAALPGVDFRHIFRRGLNAADEVVLSPDRRTLHIAFDVINGVDQIRVLVASDMNSDTL